ncbi:hypothetical protein PGTUg99_014130 [Puccinia graminis f. sp. tritici]|uniref:Uncharacterized protein n=1 Tax=Puccinia graminis f. sp. tritici TaxID=56615 RepID=A0A5B0NFK9_PUCGR|nr:hypothetical protein PGTUg99_014130 [Puccinia graminis f. sp. tritici]
MSESEDPIPQRQTKPTEPLVTGYGLHNVRGSDGEPTERRHGPRIVKEPGIVYDGTNFAQFLVNLGFTSRTAPSSYIAPIPELNQAQSLWSSYISKSPNRNWPLISQNLSLSRFRIRIPSRYPTLTQ